LFILIAGQPRRYFDYADVFTGWNSLISYGSIVSFISLLLLAAPVTLLANNQNTQPTSATTLEWMLPATPASHAFSQLPYLRSNLSAALTAYNAVKSSVKTLSV
jgi:heme/copper-type cytochrome/quinol oxidase subunit 1